MKQFEEIMKQLFIDKIENWIKTSCKGWNVHVSKPLRGIVFEYQNKSLKAGKYVFRFCFSLNISDVNKFVGKINEVYENYNTDETAIQIYFENQSTKLKDALEYAEDIKNELCGFVSALNAYLNEIQTKEIN